MTQGVPVATLLRDLAESRGIDLELLAGAGGVDRPITNPHPQKTGLALSGFDKYLREGRVLVLGESEVRFLESARRRTSAPASMRQVFSHDHPVPRGHRRVPSAGRSARRSGPGAACRC